MLIPITREILYQSADVSLQVISRDMAKDVKHDQPYAVISINTYGMPAPKIKASDKRSDVFYMHFDDVKDGKSKFAITEEQAQKLAEFINRQYNAGIRLFVIHCLQGISRSSAVAAAISLHYNGEDSDIHAHYAPNETVKCMLHSELKKYERTRI